MIKIPQLPRPVGPGATLAVVAPASPFDPGAFSCGAAWLEERYELRYDPGIFSRQGYFAGGDARRLAELRAALLDPEIDAIVCARGGYGATRLLPSLDPAEVAHANKTVVGFSDVTALHALWARAGVRSLHAPMVASLGSASDSLRERWIAALEDPGKPGCWSLERIDRGGETPAEGRLVGGNLAVLAALNGTPYAPPLEGAVLFLEDVGERPYRVDRMLTALRQSGWFETVAGIVLGAFTEGGPGPDGVTVEEVFAEHFADSPVPVLAGFPAGHIEVNEPLPLGGRAVIRGGELRFGGE